MQQPNEILPIVTPEGEVIGKVERSQMHFQKEKLLHPVVHMHLLNADNELFLQLRPDYKKVQPGKWDTAVGGHVGYGESIEFALEREAMEEIGIAAGEAVFVTKYIWETDIERELVYLYLLQTDEIPEFNPQELAGGKFWSMEEIARAMEKDILTPNLEKEIGIFKDMGKL